MVRPTTSAAAIVAQKRRTTETAARKKAKKKVKKKAKKKVEKKAEKKVEKKVKKKASTTRRRGNLTLAQRIFCVLADSQDRKGMSGLAIKRKLSTRGLDVVKENKRINATLGTLVKKGIIVQYTGKGASGSFKITKLEPVRKVKKPKTKKKAPKKPTIKKKPANKSAKNKKKVSKKAAPKKAARTKASVKKAAAKKTTRLSSKKPTKKCTR